MPDNSPLKALILSGGRGTRLRPITHTSAKQLLPIANKPILFYALECVVAAGITDIGIVVGDTQQEIRAAVGDGSRWGAKVAYIPQSEPLGLAHAVLTAEGFLGRSPFVMYLGDNLVKDGIAPLVLEFMQRRPNAQILLAHVPNPQDFGVATLDGNTIVKLEEKPAVPPTDLALVGVYMFDSTIFEAARAIHPSARNELEITDAIQHLIDTGRSVHSHIITGWWKDTGKLEHMLEANRIMLEGITPQSSGSVDAVSLIQGVVSIGECTVVTRSQIRGPAIIGANCSITDSYVGPFTSINNGVSLNHSEIEHSIVLENSSVSDMHARISDSLIGRNVVVEHSSTRPHGVRLLLGDNSQVSLP